MNEYEGYAFFWFKFGTYSLLLHLHIGNVMSSVP